MQCNTCGYLERLYTFNVLRLYLFYGHGILVPWLNHQQKTFRANEQSRKSLLDKDAYNDNWSHPPPKN